MRIELTGRIDANNAIGIDEMITDRLSEEHTEVVFDAGSLTYISSAGLRVLLKAAKAENDAGHEKVRVINACRDVYDIFEMTGFTDMLSVSKAFREVDLTGCEVIGRGFYGTVYRIDDETIVKVYDMGEESIPLIRHEQEMARLAFINGLPTAISYDIVKVGDDYGSAFELIRSDTFNDLIIKQPEDTEDIVKRYVGLLKQVHATELKKGDIPSASEQYLNALYGLKDKLTVNQIGRMRRLLIGLPATDHMVHGDIQMKNVMLYQGEPMLIDMDNMGTGDHIFDMAGLYVTYKLFNEDEPDNTEKFLGVTKDRCDEIWKYIMKYYYADADAASLSVYEDRIRLVAMIRFLSIITGGRMADKELTERRLKNCRDDIDRLLDRLDTLDI